MVSGTTLATTDDDDCALAGKVAHALPEGGVLERHELVLFNKKNHFVGFLVDCQILVVFSLLQMIWTNLTLVLAFEPNTQRIAYGSRTCMLSQPSQSPPALMMSFQIYHGSIPAPCPVFCPTCRVRFRRRPCLYPAPFYRYGRSKPVRQRETGCATIRVRVDHILRIC